MLYNYLKFNKFCLKYIHVYIVDKIKSTTDKVEKTKLITDLYNLINNTLLQCSEKTTEVKYNSKRHKFWWDPMLDFTALFL